MPSESVSSSASISPARHDGPPVIALIAGEASGDQLGADLIAALRQRYPQARLVGVGGPRMRAQGFEAWHDIDELSLMGFAEVIKHLPRLVRLRRQLRRQLRALQPDLVIGIDAPDFNLGLERGLKKAGLRTVHYVSPSIWAWRENRTERIGRSADRVLCLFPMEPPIYARHGIDARFVGHPLASRFALDSDPIAARQSLDISADEVVLAVLPGSRPSEIQRLGRVFIQAAQQVRATTPHLRIVMPAANAACHEQIAALVAEHIPPGSEVATPLVLDGDAHVAMQAADVVLLASGTATLEAMLCKRPMVVGYRVSPASYHLARLLRMLKTDIFALPNILARNAAPDAPLPVTECMQDDCTPTALATAVGELLANEAQRARIAEQFTQLHHRLRGDTTGEQAVEPVVTALADLIDHD